MKHTTRTICLIFILTCSVTAFAGNTPSTKSGSTVKAPIRGLVNMGSITFYNNSALAPDNTLGALSNYVGSFQGTVINVTWAQLQPDSPADDPAADGNVIDQALINIRAYNAANPDHPIAAKLRVWGGFTAPNWAKQLNDGPITIQAEKHGGAVTQSGTIGLWWEEDYLQYWQNLQTLLAAKYDGEPLIQEVSVTSCASATDEPFISWSDSSTILALQLKYYNDGAQQACLNSAMDHYQAWETTLLDFPFSPFTQLDSGTPVSDPDFTKTIMDKCVAQGNCVMSNQGLNGTLNNNLLVIYTYMKELYQNALAAHEPTPFIDFQTASPLLVDWCGAMQTGNQYYGQSVELWPSTPTLPGFTSLTPAQVENLFYGFTGNPAYDPSLCPASTSRN